MIAIDVIVYVLPDYSHNSFIVKVKWTEQSLMLEKCYKISGK